jgi:hypothetical protein
MIAFAFGAEPGIVLFLQPATDPGQLSGKSIARPHKIFLQPPVGLYIANGKFDEVKRLERRPVPSIISICHSDIRPGYKAKPFLRGFFLAC